jgi:hypothetical protein
MSDDIRGDLRAMAWRDSRGCPECGGKGWARRPFWSVVFGKVWVLEVYCRCPMGFLRAGDEGRMKPEGEAVARCRCEFLQALPHAWNPALQFHAWSPTPGSREWPDDPAVGRYLGFGEEAPRPSAPAAAAGRLAEEITSRKPRRSVPIPAAPNVAELPPVVPAAAEAPRNGSGW